MCIWTRKSQLYFGSHPDPKSGLHSSDAFVGKNHHGFRRVATTAADSDCTTNWDTQTAGQYSLNTRRQGGASTLRECQRACEFDPRCVAADLNRDGCWITRSPNHNHWHDTTSPLNDYVGHYHLVSRCKITPGQCFQHIPTFS